MKWATTRSVSRPTSRVAWKSFTHGSGRSTRCASAASTSPKRSRSAWPSRCTTRSPKRAGAAYAIFRRSWSHTQRGRLDVSSERLSSLDGISKHRRAGVFELRSGRQAARQARDLYAALVQFIGEVQRGAVTFQVWIEAEDD